jgi:hypothetical protein
LIVVAIGAIAVIVFTDAGTTVGILGVAIGIMLLTPIHVLTNAFPTALLVFSTNFEYLLD